MRKSRTGPRGNCWRKRWCIIAVPREALKNVIAGPGRNEYGQTDAMTKCRPYGTGMEPREIVRECQIVALRAIEGVGVECVVRGIAASCGGSSGLSIERKVESAARFETSVVELERVCPTDSEMRTGHSRKIWGDVRYGVRRKYGRILQDPTILRIPSGAQAPGGTGDFYGVRNTTRPRWVACRFSSVAQRGRSNAGGGPAASSAVR